MELVAQARPTARAERGLEMWQRHLEGCREQMSLHEELKTIVETKIQIWTAEAARAQSNLEAARAALADPSRPAAPDLTKAEMDRILRKAGVSKQQAYRARKLAALSPEEFEEYLKRRR